MLRKRLIKSITFFLIPLVIFSISINTWGFFWKIHDMQRPQPKKIDPGMVSCKDKAGNAPSDAVVLFDGTDLSQWRSVKGGPAEWPVKDGYFETKQGAGYIRTLQSFGDCQLHLEWAAPTPARGSGQGRGNSGVFLMGKYEVQILDSYGNTTYPDGQAASVYGQFPPQVNASRSPGKWQSYDIIFHAPRFNEKGKLKQPATLTVLHNGVLVQDHVTLKGHTSWISIPEYNPHPAKLPIELQDHGNPVRFRNIWVRELPANNEPGISRKYREITLDEVALKNYTGTYKTKDGRVTTISIKDNHLIADLFNSAKHELFATSDDTFFGKKLDVEVQFLTNDQGQVNRAKIRLADSERMAKKVD